MRHLQPLHLAATVADVQSYATSWVQDQVGGLLCSHHAAPSNSTRVHRSRVLDPLPAILFLPQAQARLLGDTRPGFLHARILTFFWGFADDFLISLR